MNRVTWFCLIATVLSACSPPSSEPAESDARGVLVGAITAHGGVDALREASTWKAQIRRHQRGSSYVMTNYYRPGMVRLEQDLGEGRRSADVIGDPHCWGMAGVVSIACSPETRENDRPRVIMEMAMQLWPLLQEPWQLRSVSRRDEAGRSYDVVEAYYEPRQSTVVLSFDGDIHLLSSIAVSGIKGGVEGQHLHVYSDFVERCGVQMPSHNVKSFEGEVWVEEDVLELQCIPVDESMFERPAQVRDGFILETKTDDAQLVCSDEAESTGFSRSNADLESTILAAGLVVIGQADEFLNKAGTSQLCIPVQDTDNLQGTDLPTLKIDGGRVLSIYAVNGIENRKDGLIQTLFDAVGELGLEPVWPIRITTFDNDGMGLTGEVIVEFSVGMGE